MPKRIKRHDTVKPAPDRPKPPKPLPVDQRPVTVPAEAAHLIPSGSPLVAEPDQDDHRMRGPGEPRTVFNASDPIPTEYDADELADPLDTQGVMMVKPDGRVWRVGSHTAYKLQKRFGLTYRRALFCMEYMRDLNPPAAALRAGFAPRTASAAARIVLRCPKVMDCITLLQTELCKAIDMDPTWIVEQLKMQVFKHLQMAGAEPLSREGFAVFERFGKHLGLFRDNVDLTLTADKGLKSVTVRFINPDGTEYDDRAAPADAAPHSTRQH